MWPIKLQSRDFSSKTIGNIEAKPERYSAGRIGGPEQATVNVSGADIFECLDWLRCPITIMNPYSVPVWWGYVYEVNITYGGITFGASLSELGNSIEVTYQSTPAGGTTSTETVLAFSSDAWSVAEYGTRQQKLTLDKTESTAATQYQTTQLANLKWPQVRLTTNKGMVGGLPYGSLECRGWWSTLDWLYYSNAGTTSTNTADSSTAATGQFEDTIVDYSSTNDFFNGVSVQSSSGVAFNEYRDGSRTHRAEIEDLLDIGTTFFRMGAVVLPDRSIWQYQESPSTTVNYLLDADGTLRNVHNQRVELGDVLAVGNWCRIVNVVPASLSSAILGKLNPFMIKRMEYDIPTDASIPTECRIRRNVPLSQTPVSRRSEYPRRLAASRPFAH